MDGKRGDTPRDTTTKSDKGEQLSTGEWKSIKAMGTRMEPVSCTGSTQLSQPIPSEDNRTRDNASPIPPKTITSTPPIKEEKIKGKRKKNRREKVIK